MSNVIFQALKHLSLLFGLVEISVFLHQSGIFLALLRGMLLWILKYFNNYWIDCGDFFVHMTSKP